MNRIKSLILISVLTTVLCCGWFVGTTYALLTDQTDVTVNATSGTVVVTARESALSWYYQGKNADWPSQNGETAGVGYGNQVLTVTNMSAECSLDFKVTITNGSSLSAKWRLGFDIDDGSLFDEIIASAYYWDDVNKSKGNNIDFVKMSNNIVATEWQPIAVEEGYTELIVKLELPVSTQGALSGKITIFIDAVPGNTPT